jgi:hypothetical protein
MQRSDREHWLPRRRSDSNRVSGCRILLRPLWPAAPGLFHALSSARQRGVPSRRTRRCHSRSRQLSTRQASQWPVAWSSRSKYNDSSQATRPKSAARQSFQAEYLSPTAAYGMARSKKKKTLRLALGPRLRNCEKIVCASKSATSQPSRPNA